MTAKLRSHEKDVRNEFSKMYPDAFDVEWDWEGTYWDVSFRTGSRPNVTEHEAWYGKTGNWIRTKTEIMLSSVPQQIRDFLAADSDYGTAPFADNDAEYIETPSGNFYRFDLRLNGVVVEVDDPKVQIDIVTNIPDDFMVDDIFAALWAMGQSFEIISEGYDDEYAAFRTILQLAVV